MKTMWKKCQKIKTPIKPWIQTHEKNKQKNKKPRIQTHEKIAKNKNYKQKPMKKLSKNKNFIKNENFYTKI